MAEYKRDTIEPLRAASLKYRLRAVHIAHLLLWFGHVSNLQLPWRILERARAGDGRDAWRHLADAADAGARFFRPKHVIALIKADLPKVDEIGGEFGGIKGRVRFNAQATALTVLENRIDAGEAALGRLWIVAEEHSRALAEIKMESGNASE